jgi:putative FmdB family regulatory protein
MPNYGFICDSCEFKFEKFLKMSERDLPLNEECPKCKEKKIQKDFSSLTPGLGSDSTMTPDKATGGRWSELMTKMKSGLSKKYHSKLDKTTTNSGRLWRG